MKQFHTKERENSGNCACFTPAHEPSFGARPVPGRSGSDSLLVPEPSPSRRLLSDPLRAGTSRAPDAGRFRGAERAQSSGESLPALSPQSRERVAAGRERGWFMESEFSEMKIPALTPLNRVKTSSSWSSSTSKSNQSDSITSRSALANSPI